MYFCGIDPGIANMAVCIINDDPFEIVYLSKINLFAHDDRYYKFDPKLIGVMLAKYLEANEKEYFSKVTLFTIENQMARAFFKVQFALEGMLIKYGRAVPVHPSTVKAYFGTRMNDYKKNKEAAVRFCLDNLEGVNKARFLAFAESTGKADDAADALLLAMYGMYHKDELMPVVLEQWTGAKKKSKKSGGAKRKRAKPKPKAKAIDAYFAKK